MYLNLTDSDIIVITVYNLLYYNVLYYYPTE